MGKELNTKGHNSSNQNNHFSNDVVTSQLLPPDGGWGWVVCFGSFMVNFILDGTMFSFGVLLIDLLDYFRETKSKTSLVGSALLGMSMMMGPFVSMLLQRYSTRQVTVVGALLATSGCILSILSPSVEVMILTYGILGGIGFCMMFIPALIVVGIYFNDRRAIATGIATSGSGLGTFAYAYLTNALLATYGWQGTVMIQAAILLNCVVCGLVFRPLVQRLPRFKPKPAMKCCHGAESSGSSACPSDMPDTLSYTENILSYSQNSPIVDVIEVSSVPNNLHKSGNNAVDVSLFPLHLPKPEVKRRKYSSAFQLTNKDVKSRALSQALLRPMSRKDIFYSGSIRNIPECKQVTGLAEAVASLTRVDSDMSVDASTETEAVRKQKRCCGPVSKINKVFKLELLRNKVFILLLICMTMWTAHSISLTFLPDMALSKGFARANCATLISVVGVANILGRLLSGAITDVLHVKSIHVYACALLIASAVNLALPFLENFYLLAVCCGVFGLCMASAVSLRTIVIADFLGIDMLTQAFGVIAMFQGVAFTASSPVAGFVYDRTKSYHYPYILVSGMYFLSFAACLPLLRMRNIKHHSDEDISVHNSEEPFLDKNGHIREPC